VFKLGVKHALEIDIEVKRLNAFDSITQRTRSTARLQLNKHKQRWRPSPSEIWKWHESVIIRQRYEKTEDSAYKAEGVNEVGKAEASRW